MEAEGSLASVSGLATYWTGHLERSEFRKGKVMLTRVFQNAAFTHSIFT